MASIGDTAFIFTVTSDQINEIIDLYHTTCRIMNESDNQELKKYELLIRSQLIIQIRLFWEEYYNLKVENVIFDDADISKKVVLFKDIVEPIIKDLNQRYPTLRDARNIYYAHPFRDKDYRFILNDPYALEIIGKSMLRTDDYILIGRCFYIIASLCESFFKIQYVQTKDSVVDAESNMEQGIRCPPELGPYFEKIIKNIKDRIETEDSLEGNELGFFATGLKERGFKID
jgi:hypothetical protein